MFSHFSLIIFQANPPYAEKLDRCNQPKSKYHAHIGPINGIFLEHNKSLIQASIFYQPCLKSQRLDQPWEKILLLCVNLTLTHSFPIHLFSTP